MSTVELTAIRKTYGTVVAVDDLDLNIESGEFVTLLGPSGCGKTTTLRMVAGFVRPTGGTIVLGGQDVTGVPPHRRSVGLVFQNYALFPHMTVQKNVEFGLKMRGVSQAERVERTREALAMVQLQDHGERRPGQLSGGQQQRVALARALIIRPSVLLLDEPFGALDKQLRDHMRVELRELQKQLGISTLFVTHDQDEALSMSDRIVVMAEGRVRQIGRPSEIYEMPRSRFVADFMGRSNLLDAKVISATNGAVELEAGGMRLSTTGATASNGATAAVMIRPERIELCSDGQPGGHAAVITNAVYLGSTIHYDLNVSDGPTLLATQQNSGQLGNGGLTVGAAVSVHIPDDAVYLIPE